MCNMNDLTAFKELFDIYNAYSDNELHVEQIQEMYSTIRIGGISQAQVYASLRHVCGREYVSWWELLNLFKEMDRRYFLLQDLQWEFALLDRLHVGSISPQKAEFLFRTVHGNCFSRKKWDRFLASRPVPLAPIKFAEIEVDLCSRPVPDEIWHLESEFSSCDKLRNVESEAEEQSREQHHVIAMHSAAALDDPRNVESEDDAAKNDQESNIGDVPDRNLASSHAVVQDAEVAIKQDDSVKNDAEATPLRKVDDDSKEKKTAGEDTKRAPEPEAARAQLEDAVESREQDLLEPAIDRFKSVTPRRQRKDDPLLARAERLLEMIKCRDALKDASARRILSELDEAIKKARHHGFDKNRDELAQEVANAEQLVVRLARLERLRSEVLELKQSTIAELRSYKSPIPVIHHVMVATYLLLQVPEKDTRKWTTIQLLLGKTGREGLKRRISQCKVTDITRDVANRARNIMGDVNLEDVRDISAGAATFFVWTDGMINEVLTEEP